MKTRISWPSSLTRDAVVGHVAKGQASAAIFKASGSHQWVAAARVVLGVAADRDDPTGTRRFLSPIKANVFISPRSLGFRILNAHIQDSDESGNPITLRTTRVEFEPEEFDLNIEQLFNPERVNESDIGKAMRILNCELKDGPRPETEIAAKIEAAGINEGPYKGARRRLHVHTEKQGMDKGWMLWLQDHWEAYVASKR